ncbi:MAG TPA: DUF3311 domain-containing protein [Rhizomicrobium sp.]|nr:DUF3311 domain-containing protein [Rhizomicrobium sp.]
MPEKRPRAFRAIHLLLLPPYAGLLWVASFDRTEPALFGMPFFYWYQLAWIPLGVLFLYAVYRAEDRNTEDGRKD